MRRDTALAQPPGSPRHLSAHDELHLCSLIIFAGVSSGQNDVPNPCLYLGVIMMTPT